MDNHQSQRTTMRDVVIVGAGVAGSSLATVLSQLGWDVLLLERSHFPRHKVCGEFLSPESQASLKAMGLYDIVRALAPTMMHRARFVSKHGTEVSFALPGTAWGISRFALDTILATSANRAGATVYTGVTVTEVREQPDASGYAVECRTPEGTSVVHARVAVVACGRHPLPGLRGGATPAHKRSRPLYAGFKAHYEGVSMPSQVEIYLYDGGYTGVDVIEHGRVNVCVMIRRDAFERRGATIASMLDTSMGWNAALQERMAGGRLISQTAVAVAAVDLGQPAQPWGPAARVGDAVAVIPPFTGDGMAMALRGVEVSAPLIHAFLRGRISREAWQHAHCTTWHREFDRPLWIARKIHQGLGMARFPDLLFRVGALMPMIGTEMVRATRTPIRPLDRVTSLTSLP